MYFFPGVCRFVLAVSFVVYWFLDSIELHFEIVFHVVHGTIEQTLTFLIARVYKCKSTQCAIYSSNFYATATQHRAV